MSSGSGAGRREDERKRDLVSLSRERNLLRRTPQRFFGFLDLDDGADNLRGKLPLRLGEVVDADADERFRDLAQPVEVAHVRHAPSDEQVSAFDEHGLATIGEFDCPQDGRIFPIIAAPHRTVRLVVVIVWGRHPARELRSDEIRKKYHWAAPGVFVAVRECKHFEYSKRKR